jgi:hypothetical protein
MAADNRFAQRLYTMDCRALTEFCCDAETRGSARQLASGDQVNFTAIQCFVNTSRSCGSLAPLWCCQATRSVLVVFHLRKAT